MEITDVQAMVENHLKDMILKSFDPKKADTIFTEEGKVRTSLFVTKPSKLYHIIHQRKYETS